MNTERQYRFFGISEETLRRRLADIMSCVDIVAALSSCEEDTVLRVTAADAKTAQWAQDSIQQHVGAYMYSQEDRTLEQQAVDLLKEKGKTVAVAESCTGGLLASRLTAVSGCSAVFGTGVVAYSWDCKQKQLGVSARTLQEYGAVSPQTAREMADGIRKRAGADIGIGITGEAGPKAAETQPVGTIYVALADAKRTWIKELHLDAAAYDRNAMRRIAASYGLDMLRRYMQAYPAVMAGGERHSVFDKVSRKDTGASKRQRFAETLLPWRGNSKRRLLKLAVWAAVLVLLIGGMLSVYRHILAPDTNRELQGDLADLYWSSTSDLTEDATEDSVYPVGMKAQFRGLYDINADIAGWVRIPETTLNYPVMTYADGYYENHSFNDQYSVYGQPYFDTANALGTLATDRVLTVRGNNTRDEQMFSLLLSYRRIAYLREHPVIEMDTLYTAARWEIFAVMVVDERERASTFEYVRREFADDAAYFDYIAQLQRRSLFQTDIQLTAQDRILLLVTDAQREYGFTGARLVVAARQMSALEATASYRGNSQVLLPSAMRKNTTQMTKTTTASVTASTSTTAAQTTSETVLSTTTDINATQDDTAVTSVPSAEPSVTTAQEDATTVATADAVATAGSDASTTVTLAAENNTTAFRNTTVGEAGVSVSTASSDEASATTSATTNMPLMPDEDVSDFDEDAQDMEIYDDDHIRN